MMIRRTAFVVLCLTLAGRTLVAQDRPPRSGLLPVLTAGDGTQVFVDAASVTHSGDSAYVASTVLRYPADVARQRQVDTEVNTDEIDCARERVRVITGALYRESTLVQHTDSTTGRFEPVPADWLPIVRATCGVLQTVYAATPVEREVGSLDIAPVLANRDEIRGALSRESVRLARRPHMPAETRTMVRVRILENGAVDSSSVRVMWAERSELAAATARVVTKMRFRPGRLAGTPTPVWINLPVTFQAQ